MKLIAIHVTDLPLTPDLPMVFAAKTQQWSDAGCRTYLRQADIDVDTDAGAVALLRWMKQNNVDLIFQ